MAPGNCCPLQHVSQVPFFITYYSLGDIVSPNEVGYFEKWIRYIGEYGISFVFLSATVLILIYSAVSIVRIIQEWVPKLIQSVMDSHKRVADAIEFQAGMITCIHKNTHTSNIGLLQSLRALNVFARANKERLGISSEVLVHLDYAERTLIESASSKEEDHSHE